MEPLMHAPYFDENNHRLIPYHCEKIWRLFIYIGLLALVITTVAIVGMAIVENYPELEASAQRASYWAPVDYINLLLGN